MRSLIAHGWVHHKTPHLHKPKTLKPPPEAGRNAERVIPTNPTNTYPHRVPTGLKRYQTAGDDHLITFSCYRRLPYLAEIQPKDTFETTLEKIRERHSFRIHGYVVMPTHVHILLSEPDITRLATALNVLKTDTSKQLKADQKQFWQRRYHDVNILTHRRWRHVLRYIHRNPVKAGLVAQPEDWQWSSYRHWLDGHLGRVTVESRWSGMEPLAGDSPTP